MQLNQAQELYQNAQQQMQTALNNIQEAARFVVEAENRHPNRLDICREGTQGAPFGQFLVGTRPSSTAQAVPQALAVNPFSPASGGTASPFGGGTATQPTPSAFGQPSALGQRANTFGAPAFGQPAQPRLGFGQPSAQPQASPFGQASQPTVSAFGQASQTASAFGQPSALGAKPNPFGAPAFGQPAQPAASAGGSSFGQVGQLGGVGVAKPNPFAAANAFGQNGQTQHQQSNPFGQQQTQNTNPFGQPSSQPPKANPFATANNPQQQHQSSNPFAQNPPNGTNGSAFGQPPPPQQQNNNLFAAARGGQTQQQAPTAAATQGPGTGPYAPGSSKIHPPIHTYATKNADGTLAAFKGRPVTYKGDLPGIRAFDGTWTRIWFPAGPPAYYKDTELPPHEYDERSRNQWLTFQQTGTFAEGVMPEMPPPRECTLWDF
ncbi:hypothetical protein E4U43_008236 [Claviceps pusilla]|uniref:CCCH zinc finger domain protein n=1 Tax=Claviceps pusilla TaxID=123648 RepID=A0A9P7NBG5_9HYPO|nr:hypothetical protein E4U43_008236 [Claviceps pusilla]